MACHASGLHDECLSALEHVTRAIPEDIDALKILAHLYAEKGDDESAVRTYRTLLEFKPEDAESATQLQALLDGGEHVVRTYVDDDLDITDFPVRAGHETELDAEVDEEEIHELQESDIVYDEPLEPATVAADQETPSPVFEQHDPLSTVTLAELYVQQGFNAKALDIYRTILDADPANESIRAKISELEERDLSREVEPEQVLAATAEEFEYESEQLDSPEIGDLALAFEPPASEFVPELVPEPADLPASFECAAEPEPETAPSALFEPASAPSEPAPFAPLQNQMADNVVSTLDGWLENIRRIKACR
jgi:tetratricopeptide (TPR) repeat protein